jgi:hypothetical protein
MPCDASWRAMIYRTSMKIFLVDATTNAHGHSALTSPSFTCTDTEKISVEAESEFEHIRKLYIELS